MTDTITLPRSVVEQALEALKIGHESAHDCAETFHIEMTGYEQQRHEALDAEVKQISDAVGVLRAALEQPQVKQEPVAWQYRMRPDWGSKKDCWGPWQDCTMEQAAMYQRVPLLHDWVYESRQLYTHPQNLRCKSNQHRLATLWGYEKPQPPRQPLTDEMIWEIYRNHAPCVGFARAIEAAHGIGGEA